jgi:peptidylprolyl isomerase
MLWIMPDPGRNEIMTEAIKSGDTISVDYTGKHEDGEVFDTSQGKAPLTFTVGSGMLIQGFDTAVMGMKKGESKSVIIPPEQGYGLRNEDAFVNVPRTHFPEEIPLSEGLLLELQDPEGRPVPALVAEIGEDSVKMDINHFLAGETLTFDITIKETGVAPLAHTCGCGPDANGGSDAKGGSDANCGCESHSDGCCSDSESGCNCGD